jgi:hypothetical protein
MGIKMLQIEKGQLLLKTTDFKLIRSKEDVVNIRLYEVMAGELPLVNSVTEGYTK